MNKTVSAVLSAAALSAAPTALHADGLLEEIPDGYASYSEWKAAATAAKSGVAASAGADFSTGMLSASSAGTSLRSVQADGTVIIVR